MTFLKQQLGHFPRIGFFRKKAENDIESNFQEGRELIRASAFEKRVASDNLYKDLDDSGLVERLQFEPPQNKVERELAIIFDIAAGNVGTPWSLQVSC